MQMKTNFDKKECAPGLALKKRPKVIRKWPIGTSASAEIRRQTRTLVIVCSCRPPNCKTGHFMTWKERERLRNSQKGKMHLQSVKNYCFYSQIRKFVTFVWPSSSLRPSLSMRTTSTSARIGNPCFCSH